MYKEVVRQGLLYAQPHPALPRESGVERFRSPTLCSLIAQRQVDRWVGRLRADIAHPLIGPNRKLLATFLANSAKLGLTV
ncbi:hypothetical protein, partial [Propionivibrio sp.]|uniref:hypothetical protein n=1 Tax=Propionivibrio sp. TaxID=2212460 RepID=UPI0025CD9A69